MRLSDVVSGSGLSVYAEIALLLFLAVFVAVVVRVFSPKRAADLEAARRLPLDDGDSARPGEPS